MNNGLKASKILSREQAIAHISENLEKGNTLILAMFDIDFFINVDARVGKPEGDRILERISRFLADSVNTEFTRYGGDEFLAVYKGKTAEELKFELEALRKDFRRERFISTDSIYGKVPITVSISITKSGGNSSDTWILLKSAEIGLAMAKKMGRNRVIITPEQNISVSNNLQDAVMTISGGLKGYGGDGGNAFEAGFAEPYGVEINSEGELYVVDRGNHCIRKVDHKGIISTVAGRGFYGYGGDGGQAVKAMINKPNGVAIDKFNKIYIADTGNHCIRKIDNSGNIYTIAGCGEEGYTGDGGMATRATMSRPGGVAVDDKGYVFTNDYGNNVIRMITPEGIIHTIAGSGQFDYTGDGGDPLKAALNKPYGLAVTGDGNTLYIADYGNNCIRKVDRKKNIISTVCGNGKEGYTGDNSDADKSQISKPFWVGIWPPDYLLIADGENNCIRVVNTKTNKIATLAGNGNPGYKDGAVLNREIEFNLPAGVVADARRRLVYVADYGNNAVRKIRVEQLPC